MIFVDRSKVAAPKILSDPTERGAIETQQAIAHFTGPDKDKKFKYSVYSHSTVKEALINLFRGKCAYCESVFLHVYSGDVEHFRPKMEITEASPTKPGYYWLASDWDNLLLSCRNCNQKLKHQIYSVPQKQAMGKMNQFPLRFKNRYRVKSHTEPLGLKKEEPYRLLLNPCVDDPETHLEYDDKYGIIKAKKIHGVESEIGSKSIEVYVLQRVPLVMAREKLLIEIQAQIQRVMEAVKNVSDNEGSDPAIQFYYDKILRREFSRLKQFMEPTEPYSAMAKQIIRRFLNENFGIST